MPRQTITPPNEIVAEGIESFPENAVIIETMFGLRRTLSAKELLAPYHERYHGCDKPGCILVKKRREKTYQDHYLDIYACLLCGLHKECLRSGWEIGWWGGKHVSELK